MTKLASLLDKPEQAMAATIAKLEAKAGYSSEDVRFLAENNQAAKSKIAQLGLDPDDTTGEELYYTLQSKYADDARRLEAALGLSGNSSLYDKAAKAAELAAHVSEGDEVWAIRTTIIRNLLKTLPPKKLIKNLGYRSADSCFKRQDVSVLFAAAFDTEAPTWKRQMNTRLRHLKPADYELRHTRVVALAPKGWAKVLKAPVIPSAYTGVVAINPSSDVPVLSMTLLALDELEKISLRTTHRHISIVNPALRWWHGAEHLLVWNDGEPVSLNFKDNALAHMSNLKYEDRPREHGAEAMWSQLLDRYKAKIGELPEELVQNTGKLALKTVTPPEMALEFEEA